MNSIVLQRYFVLTYLSVHTKYLCIRERIMEKTIKDITKVNTIISGLSIWIPVFLLFMKIFDKLAILQKWFPVILKIDLKLFLSGIFFLLVLWASILFFKLKGNDWSDTVDLYLNNNFKMISQKLFSCLVTMASFLSLASTDNAWYYFFFLLSISFTNMISFILLYKMTKSNKERKDVHYLFLTMCMLTNLFSTTLFFISAINITWFTIVPFNYLLSIHIIVYFICWIIFYINYKSEETE